MAIEGPGRAGVPSLTSLPRYRGHSRRPGTASTRRASARPSTRSAAMPPSCRRSCACSRPPAPAPARPSSRPGHAVRMDALHLIRAAAEFADTIERDAQTAAGAQLAKTEEEVSRRQRELQEREARDRALPAGERAPARRDAERRPERVPRAAREGPRRRDPRAPGGGGQGQPPARAVAPSGDRAHERRPRRGRADARVGARAGVCRARPCPARRRAAARPQPASARTRSARSRARSCAPRRAPARRRARSLPQLRSRAPPPVAAPAEPRGAGAARHAPPVSEPAAASSPPPPPVSGSSSTPSSEDDAAADEEPPEPEP